MTNFSKNLNTLLEKRHLTLTTVSRKAGISKSTLHGWLCGTPPRILNQLIRLADFFEISLDDLVFEKNHPNTSEVGKNKEGNQFLGKYVVTVESLKD